MLTETDVTGRSAFARLFTEQTSAITVDLPDAEEPLQLMEALSVLQGPDRDARRQAAEGVTAALQPDLRTRAFVFNTLLADKATKDRLRSYDHWLASRNLANEASDESVAALIDAVVGRYELARRWYRLKARLLGIERLAHYDRMAPVVETEQRIPYDEARELVLDCYRSFSPELGATVEEFFTGDYIDAPPLPGKRGGAFCSYAVPSAHPYVLLNYTSLPDRRADHGPRARPRRARGAGAAEGDLRVRDPADGRRDRLDLRRDDRARAAARAARPMPSARLSLLAESLDGAVAAVFRQVAMNRFEDRVHGERRDTGELSVDGFAAAWLDTQADLLGDSVELTADYGSWWSYVPHFIDTPGYVYAYAYGHLLALSVYRRYEEEGEGFVESYLELLRAGGSRSPEELGAIVGVDLTDPGFWDAGLDLIERRLEQAEETAAEAEAERS